MPRPISWLPRLHEIRRSVTNSVRSHYDRRDLQALFELQPRAAQKLLELFPSVAVGTSRLVDRESLAVFLDRAAESEDVSALLVEVRTEKAAVSRKKLRSLVRRDVEPVGLNSLPASISLSSGRLEIRFQTLEQLAEALYSIARVLESDGDTFAQMYEIKSEPAASTDLEDAAVLFKELEQLEAEVHKTATLGTV